MRDAGLVTICSLSNLSAAGARPVMVLSPVLSDYFGERTVGYNRYYAAKGVNEQVDLLIRIGRTTAARIGMYAVLTYSENDGQYRITNVQQLLDDDGLKCTDLTLTRMDELYEIATEQS